ncbi:MAG: hypothetical protein QOJ42_490, partial [Acidobacteriaceae bacterium]|nr:hypothetical protein [Acidobacteriaceae bacterium]
MKQPCGGLRGAGRECQIDCVRAFHGVL